MHFYSFEQGDPVFVIGQWSLSFQIITLENIYGLTPEQTNVTTDGEHWRLECSVLSWAGQQQRAPGTVIVDIATGENRLRIDVRAQAREKITAVKILIRDLPALAVLDQLDAAHAVPAEGLVEKYPNQLRLPLWLVELKGGQRLGFRCEDADLRAKRFSAYRERMGSLRGAYTVECIHEQDARLFDNQITVPTWVFEGDTTPESFRAAQLTFEEQKADS